MAEEVGHIDLLRWSAVDSPTGSQSAQRAAGQGSRQRPRQRHGLDGRRRGLGSKESTAGVGPVRGWCVACGTREALFNRFRAGTGLGRRRSAFAKASPRLRPASLRAQCGCGIVKADFGKHAEYREVSIMRRNTDRTVPSGRDGTAVNGRFRLTFGTRGRWYNPAEPSRAEPSRAEPSRAEPSRAEPSRPTCVLAAPPRALRLSA